MRRTLMFVCVLAAVLVIGSGAARAGGNLVWSGGISITERTDQSGIFSRIEVGQRALLIGGWFSTSGVLPVWFAGLDAVAYGDFPGIRRIERVELSPDHGKTRWKAIMEPGKGYRVDLTGLALGTDGLEWGVRSRDRHNRVILLIIPINWTSSRWSAAANHVMIQAAPPGWESMSPEMVFAHLRGFVPAWASPDPAVIAAQRALPQIMGQSNSPPPAAAPTAPHQNHSDTPGVSSGSGQNPEPLTPAEIMLVLTRGARKYELPAVLDTNGLRPGQTLVFRRGQAVIMTAQIANVVPGRLVEARIVQYGRLLSGDSIEVQGGK